MRSRRRVRAPALLLAAALLAAAWGCRDADRPPEPVARGAAGEAALPRIVSINPSLTAILLALGAGDALVGVDDFSAVQQPAVADLPRVGGLFNPSLEAVAALEPDAVVVVPSVEQRDFVARLREMDVRVVVLENIELEQVLSNIDVLGALVGRPDRAAARIEAIERTRAVARALTAGRHRPRTLMVLQRDPVFAVGRGGFLDELLAVAGAHNLGAELGGPYPQVAVEWLIDAGPEVLIDMSEDAGDPLAYWSRWPAIPAVASRRVIHLDPQVVSLPGPYLDRAIRQLVAALHGPALAAELAARTRGDPEPGA